MNEEPVDLDVYRVSKAFQKMWEDAYSDNGAIWAKSQMELDDLRTQLSEETVRLGFEMASKRWHGEES